MKKIPLRNHKGKIRAYALVDDEDYERVSEFKWYVLKTMHKTYGQSTYNYHGLLHNFILGCKRIDHKNGNGLDCQKHNLRRASNSQNMANRGKQSDNTSGFKGVDWHQRRWRAKIKVLGKSIYLGSFDNPVEAAKAYDIAAKELFGEFSLPNFPMRFPRL